MSKRLIRIVAIAASLPLVQCLHDDEESVCAQCEVPLAIVDAYPQLSFTNPLYFGQAPGDATRAFVATQRGRIHVFPHTPRASASAVYLDLHSRVTDFGGELGLLGVAFDPAYASNGFVYVNYNPVFDTSGSNPRRTHISRFSVTADPAVADPESETVLLTYEQPRTNHNGGWLGFGPDGKLYIASGDGGGAGDPDNNAQNLDVLLGKILRLNADGTIPADNPFVGVAGRDEIWAYGLRNPFRASFDRQTGTLYAGDVGQSQREEVDIIVRGGNYGWRKYEGTLVYNVSDPEPVEPVPPLHEYDHGDGRCTIIGGTVYRGRDLAGWQGAYFFADFCSAELWALRQTETGATVRFVGLVPGNPTSFGEDHAGELYITSYDGHIYRIAPGS